MTYLAHIDASGCVRGFYSVDVHAAEAIPAGAIPISDATWQAWLQDTAFQRWDSEAGALVPYTPPLPPITEADYQRAIEAHVEATAQARRYSSAATCASYVTSAVPVWAAEATAFVSWRDAVYVAAFIALEDVLAGNAEPPTIAEFIASLPVIVWPA